MSPPVILLTNDDGIDAPGLAALRLAAEHLPGLRIVAPDGPRSGCGHVVTTHSPISCFDRAEESIAVGGTPADCVRLALDRFGEDIGWVLSGINAGGNLGADVHHSGTVAAVREAALHGRPGIALSHYMARGRAVDWDQAARWSRRVLLDLMARPLEPGAFWNVNLPHPEPGGPDPDLIFCPVDESPLPLAFRRESEGWVYSGNYQQRPRQASSDVAVCFGGQIAVSKIRATTSVWPID